MNNCRKQNSMPLPMAQVAASYCNLSGTAHFVWSITAELVLDRRQFKVTNYLDTRYRREAPLSN